MFVATPRLQLATAIMQGPSRILLLTLAGVTVLNTAFILYLLNTLKDLLPVEHQYTYIGDDFPSQLPLQLPTVGLVLDSGVPHFSLHADADWGTLFPASDGFTDLGPANRTFLLSFVHQLHCLDVFRVGFATNRTGFAHHVEHCLRYMRQMVLCHADTTLEVDHPGMIEGEWEHAANGVGSVHRCRDWTVLRKYMDDHPAGPATPP